MSYLLICTSAFLTSGLTLFSGFGLGTLLMPVFALFFPVDLAVALTAIVHFLNNLFKLVLLGKKADLKVVLRFGIPAILAAFLGAFILLKLSHLPPLFTYTFANHEWEVMPVKAVIALLMIFFALFEILPSFEKLSFDPKYLPAGGFVSGFFGGISGHQGALRSAFLIRSRLSKEVFIATGVVIACLVDFTRITVYSTHFALADLQENRLLLGAATLSAFLGAFLGNKLMEKVTMKMVQWTVSALLFAIATALGMGLI